MKNAETGEVLWHCGEWDHRRSETSGGADTGLACIHNVFLVTCSSDTEGNSQLSRTDSMAQDSLAVRGAFPFQVRRFVRLVSFTESAPNEAEHSL